MTIDRLAPYQNLPSLPPEIDVETKRILKKQLKQIPLPVDLIKQPH